MEELRNQPDKSLTDIAKKFNVSRTTVANIAAQRRPSRVSITVKGDALATYEPISPETKNGILEELRRDPGQSYTTIANKFGVLYPDVEELAGSLSPPSSGNPPAPTSVRSPENTSPLPPPTIDDVGQAGPSGMLPSKMQARVTPPAGSTPLTIEQEEELRQLHDIGLDNTEIAIMLGKPRTIIDGYLPETQRPPVERIEEPLTEDQREDIERLGRDGLDAIEIASAIHVPQSRVAQYMQTDEYKYFVL